MADDPYASIAIPVDPYASIAKPIAAPVQPVQRASTFGGGMIEGAKDLGQGLMNIPQAVLHPVDTFNAMGAQQRALADRASADAKAGHYGNAIWHGIDSMLPGIGPLDAQISDEYQSGTPGAKPAAMGRALVNLLPSAAAEGARPVLARVLPKIGAEANNIAIGATAGDRAAGANPGRGLYNNGIAGFSPEGINASLQPARTAAHAATTDALRQAGSNATVDLGNALNEPFDTSIAQKTHPVTGIVSPAQVTRARNLQTGLNHVLDPATGRPTPMVRNLGAVSPLDANELKSNIQAMVDYDTPSKSAVANSALKQAGANVRQVIRAAVPQAADTLSNEHDLAAAADVLGPKASRYAMPVDKGGIIRNAITGATTYGVKYGLRPAAAAAEATPPLVAGGLALGVPPRTELVEDSGDGGAGQVDEQPAAPNESPDQSVSQGNGQADTQGNLQDQQQAAPSTQSIQPVYTPDTHTFSTKEWLKGNPGEDPDEAKDAATTLGYTITD